MTLVSGQVSLHTKFQGSIACCEQNPWVISGTIKDNITLGITTEKPENSEALQLAIVASGLEQDLQELPQGLMTAVGEKGKTLSGGQRARVSFARAIYSNAQLVLLDDVFCAVDAHVARHIFFEGIVKALGGRTRLLVTNEMKVLPYCDKIISLSENGEVEYYGGFNEFARLKGLTVTESLETETTDTVSNVIDSGSNSLKQTDSPPSNFESDGAPHLLMKPNPQHLCETHFQAIFLVVV